MLKNIIKPAWQSEQPKTRLHAIDSLRGSDESSKAILKILATQDQDQSVRRAALLKLDDPYLVFSISQSSDNSDCKDDAEAILVQLMGAKSKLREQEFSDLHTAHPEMRDCIICHSPFSQLRASLLADLSLQQKTELIADIDYSETRQIIAESLESQELLERARGLLKGRDKSAEKIIRGKLDVLHEQQRVEKDNFAAALLICEKMEYLATHEWHNDFSAKHSVWLQRWAALEFTPVIELQNRFTRASDKVATDVAHVASLESAQVQQLAMAEALEGYCNDLSTKTLGELNSDKLELIQQHGIAVEQWQKLTAITAPNSIITSRVVAANGAISSAAKFCANDFLLDSEDQQKAVKNLRKAIAELQWPASYPALEAKTEAQQRLEELSDHLNDSKQSEAEKLDKLHKRINRLLGTSNRGDLSKAKRELAAITKIAARYASKDKSALDERLEQASELLSKMTDWKDFATEPKFIELCDAMEKLLGSKKHADKLAVDISKLQDAWKALGHSDSADKHWERFKKAADGAYKPCAEFFEKRHETRRKNLAQRELVVQRMRELLEKTDWDSEPDYKAIENELQGIHNAWQKIKDVERNPGQKQWNRISKLRAKVYEQLDIVYDANIGLKQGLVKQAKAMLEGDLKTDPIAKLKHLQSKWKEIGVTRRKQDQQTWKEFKLATDSVFAQIQNLRNEMRSEEDAKVEGHRAIIKAIQLLSRNAESLAEADHQFEQLTSEYQALPNFAKGLHEKLIERIEGDYQRAENSFSKTRDLLLSKQKQGAVDLLINKAALCFELEQLGEKAAPEEVSELKDQLDQIEIANKDHRQRMQKRIEHALDQDKSEAGQVRRKLCVDLEILNGVDSPAEDSALRMQTQLERMKTKGLGQGQSQPSEKIKLMKIDWLCLPGAEPSLQASLDKRFSALVGNK
ncbi:MAG: exonuclease SbcC [Cryomorphaceae bacterium]|jgi:exonuclease SbcC